MICFKVFPFKKNVGFRWFSFISKKNGFSWFLFPRYKSQLRGSMFFASLAKGSCRSSQEHVHLATALLAVLFDHAVEDISPGPGTWSLFFFPVIFGHLLAFLKSLLIGKVVMFF